MFASCGLYCARLRGRRAGRATMIPGPRAASCWASGPARARAGRAGQGWVLRSPRSWKARCWSGEIVNQSHARPGPSSGGARRPDGRLPRRKASPCEPSISTTKATSSLHGTSLRRPTVTDLPERPRPCSAQLPLDLYAKSRRPGWPSFSPSHRPGKPDAFKTYIEASARRKARSERRPFSLPKGYVATGRPSRSGSTASSTRSPGRPSRGPTTFVDIEGDLKPLPRFPTRVKMLWDDTTSTSGRISRSRTSGAP